MNFLDLAGEGEREGVHEDLVPWCLVGGQVGAAVGRQLVPCHGVTGSWPDERRHLLAPVVVGHPDDYYLRDCRVGVQELLDLAG